MDKHKLAQRLMTTFVVELDEHVREINRDLLALEKEPAGKVREELFQSLFRAAHSMKGAARSVGVPLIEGACHRLEELFAATRDGRVTFEPSLFSLLFAVADALDEAAARLREQQELTACELTRLLPKLDAAVGGDRSTTQRRGDEESQGGRGTEAGGGTDAATQGRGATETHGDGDAGTSHGTEQGSEKSGSVATSPRRSPLASPDSPQPPASRTKPREPARTAATVRVPAEKLDSLLAQSGELLVARRRVEFRIGALAGVREFLGRWRTEWDSIDKTLCPQGRAARGRAPVAAGQSSVVGCSGSGAENDGPRTADHRLRRADNGLRTTGNGPIPHRAAMVLAQTGERLCRLERELDQFAAAVLADGRLLDHAAGAVDDEVRRVRMLPFADACEGLERTVHDLAQAGGKSVDLVIEGSEVELDRSILEGLKDPLLHLVRNAMDHGVETPNERQSVGKPERARITVAAALRGAQVEVVVADDGRGLNMEALREQARRKNLPEPSDDRELARLIFVPGFSTARIITDVSGRGVGLDVVKIRVEALHGTVDVCSQATRGTRFTLTLPLTLTTLRAVLFIAAGQTFALANAHVDKLVRIGPEDLHSVEGREVLSLGGPPVPVISLAESLGLTPRESDKSSLPHRSGERSTGELRSRDCGKAKPNGGADGRSRNPVAKPANGSAKLPVLVVAAGTDRVAFVVDELIAEQEIVVKSLGARIKRVRNASGATLLPSGRIALVLNAANLVRSARGRAPARTLATTLDTAAPEAKRRLLVAEDSLTTRTLMKSILEAAGYDVTVAADGEAAWQTLQAHEADLVVSDVEMPRLDGFAFTEAIRGSKRFHGLPVILVTARESDQDKTRGIQVGANAYLVKSAFDQRNLLETIGQLL